MYDRGDFEVWLSARNRNIAKSYSSLFNNKISSDGYFFHDPDNPDAIIEYVLASTPDFENQSSLIDVIDIGVEKFINEISKYNF